MEKSPKNFIASVEENHARQIDEIARQLEAKGCKITSILTTLGIITGCSSGEESNLEELKIQGIKHIEEDRPVKALGEDT